MRKIFFLTLMVVLVAAWVGCGDSTHSLVPTSQLAFIRSSAGSAGLAASMHQSLEQGSLRAQSYARKPVTGPGLQPYLNTIANGTDSIVLMNNDGSGEKVVSPQGGTFWAVQLSPDGTKGVGTAADQNGNQQIFIANMKNLQNSNPLQLTNDVENHYVPQISPDNRTVIFVKYDSASDMGQAFTIPASGGTETLISSPTVDVWTPSYTPDGTKIVFEDDILDTINIMSTNGTGMKVLTNPGGTAYFDGFPSVSPNGKKLVFSRYGKSTQTAGEDVYIANIDGTGVTQLTTTGATADSWDPIFVNTKIVFVNNGDIYSMNYDGTNLKNISNNSADEYFMW
jgi:Tol biopolymer transport system component